MHSVWPVIFAWWDNLAPPLATHTEIQSIEFVAQCSEHCGEWVGAVAAPRQFTG